MAPDPVKNALVFYAVRLAISLCILAPMGARAIDISDVPLETYVVTAPPIVMFVFDNSGSMDLEFMTDEPQGLFQRACYLFSDDAYKPRPDHAFGIGRALGELDRRRWRSQWAGYNRIFYAPAWRYLPWPATGTYPFNPADLHHPVSDPTQDRGAVARIEMAGLFFTVRSGTNAIDVLNAHYFTHFDADSNGRWDAGETIYLVTWADINQDGYIDLKEAKGVDQRRYFRLADDGDGVVEDNELILVADETEKNLIRPGKYDYSGNFQRYLTDKEELQNFVNWVTYYRRRGFTAKAATARALSESVVMNAGLYAVNAGPRIGAIPLGGTQSGSYDGPVQTSAEKLLNALYAANTGGSTPLRQALDQVGRYLHQDYPSDLGASPFYASGAGGDCQRACAIVITDGFWNGSFSGIGNADGTCGKPYADGWSDTLADVAMRYYEIDLGPNLTDAVPLARCDSAAHQHMNTYTISLGYGTRLDTGDAAARDSQTAACMRDDPSVSLDWPQPFGHLGVEGIGAGLGNSVPQVDSDVQAAVEDLRHAALNGRGRFIDANAPQILPQALPAILAEMNGPGCGADIAVNGTGMAADSMVFQASYRTKDWSGEVSAFSMSVNPGQDGPSLGPALWRASGKLPGGSGEIWDQRRIVTYGGRLTPPRGIPFRYDQMSSWQMAALGSDLVPNSAADDRARNLVDFIRGKSFSAFRVRETLLGDIVHSAPVLFGRTLFVGANDGMLHAFDTGSGAERFAYIPSQVYDHLDALADVYYADQHRCYVDGPLFVGEVIVGDHQRKAYVVGGLGKGGRGYFCLLVGQRERSRVDGRFGDYEWRSHVDALDSSGSESQTADLVRWEYPRPDVANDFMDNDNDGFVDEVGEVDPNLGFSFSQAYAVNANCVENSYRPVVVFGNGYDSDSQKALLYVLAADTGEIVRIIDTGASGDNGLSTPALIDVNLDRKVDYAYAGDLNGNLWKFDLTADNPRRWGVAYGIDMNGNGVIDAADGDLPAPLFQAPGQPVTGRPDVMVMHGSCASQAPGYMVFFGTGRYLGATDMTDSSQQSLFAIWDYGDDSDDAEHLGWLADRDNGLLSSGLTLMRKQIVDETTLDGTAYRQLTSDDIDYAMVDDEVDADGCAANNVIAVKEQNPKQYAGWFLDFPLPAAPPASSAERALGDVVIRNGMIAVSSYVPDARLCGSGGRSWLYLLSACTGDLPLDSNAEPVPSHGYLGKISERPVIVKNLSLPRRDLILFGDHAGRIQTLDMAGENWGKVYWRQN